LVGGRLSDSAELDPGCREDGSKGFELVGSQWVVAERYARGRATVELGPLAKASGQFSDRRVELPTGEMDFEAEAPPAK
jgi:hypothetical protein